MKYVNMPGTGLIVSKACLGTMTFGGQVSEEDAVTIVKTAADEGINYIDTADVYTKGESEKIVGKALKGNRDRWILESKVCNSVGDELNDNGLSRRHIMQAVENSLKRLQTDYIDVYYLHRPDHRTPFEETMRAMDDLIHQGKVRYIGISNFAAWEVTEIVNLCKANLLTAPVINQTVYNLLTRGIEDELLPMGKAHGMGVMVYNPLASGLLTGKFKRGEAPLEGTRLATSKMYNDRYWNDDNLLATEEFAAIAAKAGMSLVEMSMRFVTTNPSIDCVLLGVSKTSQLQQNLSSILADPLNEELMQEINSVYDRLPVGNRFKYFR